MLTLDINQWQGSFQTEAGLQLADGFLELSCRCGVAAFWSLVSIDLVQLEIVRTASMGNGST